jgi:hypothetical protein
MGVHKYDLGEVAEVMFEVGKWPWEHIIWLLDVFKYVFCEVNEAMLQGVERPCELILCILGMEKMTWTK